MKSQTLKNNLLYLFIASFILTLAYLFSTDMKVTVWIFSTKKTMDLGKQEIYQPHIKFYKIDDMVGILETNHKKRISVRGIQTSITNEVPTKESIVLVDNEEVCITWYKGKILNTANLPTPETPSSCSN